MWSRRIMIGCGAVFLIALMLVCAFSLGVYSAERGITQSINTRAAQGRPPRAPYSCRRHAECVGRCATLSR